MEGDMNIENLTKAEISKMVDDLDGVKELLPARDQEFAQSLINHFRKRGYLSTKQFPWIERLISKAVLTPPKPETVDLEASKVAGILAIFKAAESKIKWPKLKLETDDGHPVVLSLAGPKAKFPGSINITDGKPFGENHWYGRIHPDGNWEKPFKQFNEMDQVSKLLRMLANAPGEFASMSGKKTGQCCFCNKPLEQANSVAAGFGPVCASNWGLTAEWKAAVEKANN
jgi:hypothetical protein